MKVVLPIAAIAALSLFAFAPAPGHAISPSQAECEAAGGDFSRVQGEVQCVMVEEENVGKSENSETTTTTTETSGRGNIDNKTEESSRCTGPGASTTSSHCK